MTRSLQGRRVQAELFGTGTVTEHPLCGTLPGLAQVLWDEAPPREYSLSNPAVVLAEWLEEVPGAPAGGGAVGEEQQ